MNAKHLAALCALLPGCVVDDSPAVIVSGDGLLTVNWTVDGTTDPVACSVEGADAIDIQVTTPGGALVAEANDDCRAGTTSVELAPGSYFADAVMLDRASHTITSTVDLGGFRILGDDELVLEADFPADSFF